RVQAEDGLAELYQTDMGVELVRDMAPLGIGADHQTWHTRAIAERVAVKLREGILRALRHGTRPGFHHRRLDVIIPPAPIIPGDKDRRLVPQGTSANGLELLDRPAHPIRDVLCGVLAPRGLLGRVEPGHRREMALARILGKRLGVVAARMPFERSDVLESIATIVAPGKA